MNKSFFSILVFVLSFAFASKSFATPLENNVKVCIMLIVADDDDDDDEATVTAIFTTLQNAEKIASMLKVELSASKDPITDNTFLFNLKSEGEKDLIMKILDEEGKEVGENEVITTTGSNYKHLNVEKLEDGTYKVRFADNKGAEYEHEIVIKRAKQSE